ncbi:MAG: hypothetical protein AVDCRST_MAG71-1511 [uncultured Lysobacter sp.]|uniref:Integral membrane protein CcmA involved in cell shape determination n=1 Tax=uncultured Lysobacter sp. TaxID=271060 RepID=A0A6J4L8N8_9GAMM|nr:MAG: hypothetical protein AVDCRST_MAG71-1511 [uncultured Lysobacter sp.]
MAIFPASASKRASLSAAPESALPKEPDANEFSFNPASLMSGAAAPAARPAREARESVVASDVSIEGKIQGAGHVRIAGRFKGDVHVEGNLTIEVGAKVSGAVRARRVVLAGELEGDILAAEQVELTATGAMTGDINASAVTIAAGARVRGQVNFGWNEAASSDAVHAVAGRDEAA